MKEFFINSLNLLGLAWWVKISTDNPRCTYYFGPFVTQQEAKNAQPGYIEDLENEGAQGINLEIGRFKPNDLTIYEEGGDSLNPSQLPIFGGQT